MPNDPKEYSTRLAAQLTGVSHATIVNHINKGSLKARKQLNRFKIKHDDLVIWAYAQGLSLKD